MYTSINFRWVSHTHHEERLKAVLVFTTLPQKSTQAMRHKKSILPTISLICFIYQKLADIPTLSLHIFPLIKHSIIKMKVKIISQRQPKEGNSVHTVLLITEWWMTSGFRQLNSIQCPLFTPFWLYSILHSTSEFSGKCAHGVYWANKRDGSHKCLLILVQA